MDNVTDRNTDLAPGEAREEGPSTRDIIIADGWDVPAALIEESYEFMGDEDISYERYTSPAFFQDEIDKMWPRVWQWACREEHIPEVGDYYVYEVGPWSVIVVRSGEDEIKAFLNSCTHRGTKVCPPDSHGTTTEFRCPFHGWRWELDGALKFMPGEWDFPHVCHEKHDLQPVLAERWGGFVFINIDLDAMPLKEWLEILPDHFANWPLEDRYIKMHIQKTLPANWKAAQEAFIEAYHSFETHSQGLPISSGANAQYDIFGERVTRFVHTRGRPSPLYDKEQTEQEILEKLGMAPPGTKVPEGKTARAVAAEHLRQAMGAEGGFDVSKASDSEMLDSIEYHLFPNMFLFPGISLPMIYRFRPNGMDPDSSIFDLLFLSPLPQDGSVPDTAEPVKIAVNESYTKVPGINPYLGQVYDQDTSNLKMQQEGFKTSRKTGETLGNYQEVRIRRVHKTLDQFLNA